MMPWRTIHPGRFCPALAGLLVALAVLLLPAGSAYAATRDQDDRIPLAQFCHAVTATPPGGAFGTDPAHFNCAGTPDGYQRLSLWLRADAAVLARGGASPQLMVHSSRFDRLTVEFLYADGFRDRQAVRSGNYGSRWRLGGQIAFVPPDRAVPLQAVVLRFDRLASANLLRIRIADRGAADIQSTALAGMIGAALTLLAIGALYNLALAIAVRRQFPAWQAAWAGSMVLWGAMWSQAHLFFTPGLAGAISAQACTTLSCLAILFATVSLVTAIEPVHLPRALRRATVGLAAVCGALGVPLGLMRNGPLDLLGAVLGVIVLVVLALTTACLVVAWRRGSSAARAFVGAWAVPMAVLGLSNFIDTASLLWGGGSQMLVLLAASWQTVWLSVAATRRFTRMRIERDRALVAEAVAHEQARRDPLTGLRNRRGLIERIDPALDRLRAMTQAPEDDSPCVALLLLDVDHFKLVNDTYGHEGGDAVLVLLARRLERWDEGMCTVARLGGEEFALFVTGMGRFAVLQLAEAVRAGVADCDFRAVLGNRALTISVGVALGGPADDFATLYRTADAALYAAKHQGRNRVVIAPDAQDKLGGATRKARAVLAE